MNVTPFFGMKAILFTFHQKQDQTANSQQLTANSKQLRAKS